MQREIKTKIINTQNVNSSLKTKIINTQNVNSSLKTKIINTQNVNRSLKTKIINTKIDIISLQKKKVISMLIPPELRGGDFNEIAVEEKKSLNIVSYIDNKKRAVFLKKLINNGSYNNIFSFSRKKSHNIDPNLIIRISNKESSVENINSELQGIKNQYKLCLGENNIGNIIDYGMLYNPSKNSTFRLQEYSIIEKYGLDLKKVLENSPKFQNIGVIVQFMKKFLKDINYIHNNNYAHLDLKPSNILLKNITSIPKRKISKLEYAIVDFGAAKKFTSNTSRIINEQMASAAFSPPELLKRKFGKKSDIWAYGVICYLVCVRKFFFKANAQRIFMSQNKKEIERNISIALDKLYENMLPKTEKTTDEVQSYIYPLKNTNFYLLQDFFRKVFTIESGNRPTSDELLKHKLFKLI